MTGLIEILRRILAEPYGCSLCDSGVPRNPEKGHQPDCPYSAAREAVESADRNAAPETSSESLNWHAIIGPNGMCLCGVQADGTVVRCGDLLDRLLSSSREERTDDR